jgi:hypothetical protein
VGTEILLQLGNIPADGLELEGHERFKRARSKMSKQESEA